MDDQIDCRGDLLTHNRNRQINTCHQHHHFKARKRVSGGIGVDRCERTLMPRVHCLEHVECLAATTLTDNDSVGTHTQRIADEVTNRDGAPPLKIRRPRFERHQVRIGQSQLCRILNRDQALTRRDQIR
jgi:hypothetical protein